MAYTYALSDLLGLELHSALVPNRGQADWLGITEQLVTQNQVTPDISRMSAVGSSSLVFSPVHLVARVNDRTVMHAELFLRLGFGLVRTRDDLEALQKSDVPIAVNTERQTHPALARGVGARLQFGKRFALRVEGRRYNYVEVLESMTLEVKNPLILTFGTSFFLTKTP